MTNKIQAVCPIRMSPGVAENGKPSTGAPSRAPCSKSLMAGTVSVVAFLSVSLFVVFWCTNIFRDAILSNLIIRNGTSMFDWWQRPPVRPVYRVYVFNYTNVEDFESGRAPKLKIQEVGPYVYRETLSREYPIMSENGSSVSFQEKRSFQWEGGSPDDEMVTVPNIPLLAAVAFARDMSFLHRIGVTTLLTTTQSKTFIKVSAGGYLWGYSDKIFDVAKPFVADSIPFDQFGVLAFKAGLSRDRVTIKTGEYDVNELGMVTRVNGNEKRDVWGDDTCDKIEGTDGTVFPPYLFENASTTLKIYARDMCRSLPLRYHGQGNVHGIPTLTYKPPVDALTSSHEKDSCYCSRDSPDAPKTCPPAGIFNSSACSFNMPFLISYPHFYGGDPSLLSQFEGLQPQADLHDSVVEIHPRLGVPIGGHSRIQLNVEARKAVGVPFLGRLKDGQILPLVWIEVAIDKMPEFLVNTLRQAYFTAGTVEAFLQWTSLIGIVFSICSAVWMLK